MSLSILNKNLTLFIPFFNEEAALGSSVSIINECAKEQLNDYEIILVNDGSTDNSLKIAQDLSIKNSKIKIIDFKKNMGFGAAYLEGIAQAKFNHALYLTADGDVYKSELTQILSQWDGERTLIQYAENTNERTLLRNLLSVTFSATINFLNSSNWPYFNGFNIYDLKNKNSIKPINFGFCTQAYVFIHLISIEQQPIILKTTSRFNDANSKSLTFKNFFYAFRFILYIVKRRYESIFC